MEFRVAAEHLVDIDQAPSIRAARELVCMDSPLERTGFELPVPWKTPGVLVRGGYVLPRLFLAKRNEAV